MEKDLEMTWNGKNLTWMWGTKDKYLIIKIISNCF
jgi:hypothetical protein